jgi:hypothetical protein
MTLHVINMIILFAIGILFIVIGINGIIEKKLDGLAMNIVLILIGILIII